MHLACTEIRHCGAGSIQVMRRMRSMLENLMQTLPPHRHAELRQQLELLDRTIEGQYAFPEDRALARIPDPQGLGGALGVQPVSEAPTADGGGRDDLHELEPRNMASHLAVRPIRPAMQFAVVCSSPACSR